MNPRVRDLYKRVIVVGRQWPGGLGYVRKKAKVREETSLDDRENAIGSRARAHTGGVS